MASKHGLGRGLGALLDSSPTQEIERVQVLSVSAISPNPKQPRKYFNISTLEELSASLK